MSKAAAVLTLLFLTCRLTVSTEIYEFAKNVSDEFSLRLLNHIKTVTNYHKIKEDFESLLQNDELKKKKVVGEHIIRDFKKQTERLLKEKADALKRLKEKAEAAKKLHVDDESIEKFNYLNMDVVSDESVKIHPSFSLSAKVNMTHSFIQVPRNVYPHSAEILNAVNWTKSLDETFKDNHYNHSEEKMLYQYYADNSGMMRLYPGNRLTHGSGKVDLYDSRRRVWFTQSAASPKDIVFVIDMSGSMTGTNKGIARLTVRSLVDTLNENDFFNIITVNDEVKYLKPSVKYLIQGTQFNKEAMKEALNNLGAPANFTPAELGLEEAFKLLNKSGNNRNYETASCNRAIVFLSDGVEGKYVGKSVFDKYNPEKSVRVFVYMLGVKTIGKKGLLKMACENRGFFSRIESVGSIWNKTSDFFRVMSRPMFLSRNDVKPIYSPMYLDHGGLGMIMSVSISVFDDKEFIGVMGTDITLTKLKDNIPQSILGPLSHIFMIDNNGYVIIHPKLRVDSWQLTDKNVFIEDLESGVYVNRTLALKRNMIEQKFGGSMIYPIYYSYDGERKLAQVSAKVYYEPIDGTMLAAAAVVSDHEVFHYNFKNEAVDRWLNAGIDSLASSEVNVNHSQVNHSHVQIARWEYCKKPNDGSLPKNMKHYYTAVELRERLQFLKFGKIDDLDEECDKNLVKRLLVTAGIVNERVKETWIPEVIGTSLYESVFVATSGGYSKYISYKDDSYPFERDFYNTPLFLMAAANPKVTLSISAPYSESNSPTYGSTYFTVTASIRVGNEKVLKAVSGAKIHSNFFDDLLSSLATEGPDKMCSLSDTHLCIVLDRNAYIIASNQGNKYVGSFVGELSSLLIEKLTEVGIFNHVELEDTQADCLKSTDGSSSDSISLISPFKFILQGFSTLFQTVSMIALQYVAFVLSPANLENTDSEEGIKKVSCTVKTPFYIFQEDRFNVFYDDADKHKEVHCANNCNMVYYLNVVNDTNLLYLMVKMLKRCRAACTQQSQHLKRTRSDNISGNLLIHRYRRQPTPCFNQPTLNESTFCGGGINMAPQLWILILLLMFSILSI